MVGVGVSFGVGVTVDVGLTVNVEVADGLGVSEGAGVAEGSGVAVSVGAGVAVGAGIAVGAGVAGAAHAARNITERTSVQNETTRFRIIGSLPRTCTGWSHDSVLTALECVRTRGAAFAFISA
jgi:hypothetical protein